MPDVVRFKLSLFISSVFDDHKGMKILIIDRDEMSAQLLQGKLTALGHDVACEGAKNEAIARLSKARYDVVFIDPSPMKSARPLVLDIKRHAGGYPYIFLMGESMDPRAVLSEGVNDLFPKPLQMGVLEEKIANAFRLCKFIEHIRDESEDFPSAGGVISKSAFAQLFLSGLDRADRYAERSYIIKITISNYKEVYELDGSYGADYVVAKLSQHLVLNRRQSDIIGQTGKGEFSLLLLRPLDENEPADAANRIAQMVSQSEFSGGQELGPVDIQIKLIDIPAGAKFVEHRVSIARGL